MQRIPLHIQLRLCTLGSKAWTISVGCGTILKHGMQRQGRLDNVYIMINIANNDYIYGTPWSDAFKYEKLNVMAGRDYRRPP